MKASIYQAALWCPDCANELRYDVPQPEGMDPNDEHTWDSDDWPKGPYPDGGGEADCPQHCDGCGVFLENPLTVEGRTWLADTILNHLATGWSSVLETWAAHYCPDFGWVDPSELSEDERKALKAWADNVGDAEYALEKWWDAFRGIHDSMEEYAWQLAEDIGGVDPQSFPGRYFDAEALARDLELSGDCFFAEIAHNKVAVFDNHV